MAIVNITIDTEAVTISASVNGADVPNVERIYVWKTTEYEYGEDPEPCVKVELVGSEKTEDVKKTWMICASQVDTSEDKSVAADFMACLTSK